MHDSDSRWRDLDSLRLSNELERIDGYRLAREAGLKLDPDPQDDPFVRHRALLSKETMSLVAGLPADDPLRRPLMRWLHLLTERRVNQGFHVECHRLRYTERLLVTEPVRGKASLAEMLANALEDTARRAAWLGEFVRNAAELSRRSGVHWQRRAELAKRLSVDPAEMELPGADLVDQAWAWLRATDDLWLEFKDERLETFVERGLGREVLDGWPSRINERMIADWFRGTALLDDVSPELASLPKPLGVSSYCRALYAFGYAFRRAAASQQQPFVVAHDPFGLEAWAAGSFFGQLPRERAFLTMKLELSKAKAEACQRVLARMWLAWTRRLAFEVTLRPHALESYQGVQARFEELAMDGIGVPLNPTVALVLPLLHEDCVQRFAGCFLSATRLVEFQVMHDEDWFRNPRAIDQLRSEAELSPTTEVDVEQIAAGRDVALRRLVSELG